MTTTRPTTSTRAADPVAADLEDPTPMNSTTTNTITTTDSSAIAATAAGTATATETTAESYERRARELATYVFSLDVEFGPGTEPYPYRDLDYGDPLTDDPDQARGWRFTLHRIGHTVMALRNSVELTRDHAHHWARWAAIQAEHRLPWAPLGVDIDDLTNMISARSNAARRTAIVIPTVVDLDAVATTLVQAVAAADAVAGAYERHATALDEAADQQTRDLVALYLNPPPVEQDNPSEDPTVDEDDEEGLADRLAAERFAAIEDQVRLEGALLIEFHRRWAS